MAAYACLGEIGSFPAECRERIHQLVVSFDRGTRDLIVDQDSGFAHTGYDGLRILLIHRESRVSVPETGAKRSPWAELMENALRKGGGPANRQFLDGDMRLSQGPVLRDACLLQNRHGIPKCISVTNKEI